MKKQDILKEIVLDEYGECEHSKITKEQLRLEPQLFSEVERMYKELGGTNVDDFPIRYGSWDISTRDFIIELDEENHFNRYRLLTLKSDIYQQIKGFPINDYRKYCENYESSCVKFGKFWKTDSTEKLFIKSDINGKLDGSGSSRWRQRAFYDYLKDFTGIITGIPVIRISIYQNFEGMLVKDILNKKDKKVISDLVHNSINKWL